MVGLAGTVRVEPFDLRVEDVARRARVGVEHALHVTADVVGGEDAAVVEANPLAQMEGEDLAVVGLGGKGVGEGGDEFAWSVVVEQPVEEEADGQPGDVVEGDARVEAAHRSFVVEHEGAAVLWLLVASALIARRLGLGRRQSATYEHDRRAEAGGHQRAEAVNPSDRTHRAALRRGG